ncbi:MAG: hypothetical protein RLZZ232_1986 [Planctomycetota bacterium]|jgi:hypothetical protein
MSTLGIAERNLRGILNWKLGVCLWRASQQNVPDPGFPTCLAATTGRSMDGTTRACGESKGAGRSFINSGQASVGTGLCCRPDY